SVRQQSSRRLLEAVRFVSRRIRPLGKQPELMPTGGRNEAKAGRSTSMETSVAEPNLCREDPVLRPRIPEGTQTYRQARRADLRLVAHDEVTGAALLAIDSRGLANNHGRRG